MKEIFKYHIFTLLRFRISEYQFLPEYIGLFLFIGLTTLMALGVTSEDSLIFNNLKIVNFNYLALFYLVMPILTDAFMIKSYSPNYRYLKLLFPFKLSKIIFIDILFELISFKLAFIIFFIIMYVPFCITYDLDFGNNAAFLGFILILLMYINSCLLIRIIKDTMRDKAYTIHKNYFRFFVFLFLIIIIINENINIFKLDEFNTIYWFFNFAVITLLILVITIYLINIKYDKL